MFRHVLGRAGLRRAFVAAAALGVAVAVAPGTALAANGNVTCTTEIDGGTITGNVTVPAGAVCFLNGSTPAGLVIVEGNVSVGEGAAFFAIATTMRRNLSTEGASIVAMEEGVEVDGNSSFDATSGSLFICGSGTVCVGFTDNPGIPNPNPNGPATKFGNVSITNTSPGSVNYGGNYVAGDLTCYGNTSVSNGGFPNTVEGTEYGQCAGL